MPDARTELREAAIFMSLHAHGVGCEVLWVQWLEYVMGWPGVGGALLGWQGDGWLVGQIVSWHFGRFVGWRTGRSLVGKEGGD